jgi:hypothetical protein
MKLGIAVDRLCWALLLVAIWFIKDPIIFRIAITLLIVETVFVRHALTKR